MNTTDERLAFYRSKILSYVGRPYRFLSWYEIWAITRGAAVLKRLPPALCLIAMIALPAFGQVICAPLGSGVADCSGPNNRSSTQVQLGPNQGVIITDRETVPYTTLSPGRIIDPAAPISPLPELTPLPSLGVPSTGGTSDMLPLFAPMDSPVIILGQ